MAYRVSGMANTQAEADRALFVPVDENCVRPTTYARGPWSLEYLHGGPVAALLAHAIESLQEDESDWFTSRLTVELERPVPVEMLRYVAEITRTGRTVTTVEAAVTNADTGTLLARGRAVRIRARPVPLPFDDPQLAPLLRVEPAPSVPSDGRPVERDGSTPTAFHTAAIEQRFVGDIARPGPIFDWIRARVPLVPGRSLSPLERVAAAADQASGISAVLPGATHNFINPDLTVHLFRPLRGEWVGMSSSTHHHTEGSAMTNTAIFDLDGRVGNSNQSLVLTAR
jgi:acyl-coenzyme A thioesterase PaaI-like protein